MSAATALYSPQVLSLATSLFNFPPRVDLPFSGQARSAACGSTLSMQLGLDSQLEIETIGLQAHACAIGQAAAAIFAKAAIGKSPEDISRYLARIEGWLSTGGATPDWPGLETIAAARGYPGRHGAMLLPWKAAQAALSSAAVGR